MDWLTFFGATTAIATTLGVVVAHAIYRQNKEKAMPYVTAAISQKFSTDEWVAIQLKLYPSESVIHYERVLAKEECLVAALMIKTVSSPNQAEPQIMSAPPVVASSIKLRITTQPHFISKEPITTYVFAKPSWVRSFKPLVVEYRHPNALFKAKVTANRVHN